MENSSLPTQATSIHRNCVCSTLASSPTPNSSLLQLGLLNVTWKSECKGNVKLSLYQRLSSPLVCHGSWLKIERIFKTVCQERRNCKGAPRWSNGETTEDGVNFADDGIEQGLICKALTVQCTGRSTGTNGMV